jgi:hypothetical protein
MLPVYSALHFIPMLVLRRKSFAKAPLKMLGKAMLGTFRSSSFLAVFIMIYQGMCGPLPLDDLLIRRDGRSPVLADSDSRGICGWRPAKGNASAVKEKGKLLVDRIRHLLQLVRGGEGISFHLWVDCKQADILSLCRNEEQNWVSCRLMCDVICC